MYYSPIPVEISDEIYEWEDKYIKLSENYCINCGRKATHVTKG